MFQSVIFMTQHGFAGIGGGSNLKNIAKEVSRVRGVKKAVVVYGPDYNIMAQFDLSKHPAGTLQGLLADIYKIVGVKRVDTWVGADELWYKGGQEKKIKDNPMP